jgi:activator of HSP90 ATPase
VERIHQEIVVDAPKSLVYGVLTDAARFSQMSGGAPTEIDAKAGGAFSCFGGMITGRNIECVPGELLVQAWRAKPWGSGVYSIVRFELRAEGSSTKVALDHAGFPEGQGEHLDKGWHANYWEPLRKLLSEQ